MGLGAKNVFVSSFPPLDLLLEYAFSLLTYPHMDSRLNTGGQSLFVMITV